MQQSTNYEQLFENQPNRLRVVDISIAEMTSAVSMIREQERLASVTPINYDGTSYNQVADRQTAEPDAHTSPLSDDAVRILEARKKIDDLTTENDNPIANFEAAA